MLEKKNNNTNKNGDHKEQFLGSSYKTNMVLPTENDVTLAGHHLSSLKNKRWRNNCNKQHMCGCVLSFILEGKQKERSSGCVYVLSSRFAIETAKSWAFTMNRGTNLAKLSRGGWLPWKQMKFLHQTRSWKLTYFFSKYAFNTFVTLFLQSMDLIYL